MPKRQTVQEVRNLLIEINKQERRRDIRKAALVIKKFTNRHIYGTLSVKELYDIIDSCVEGLLELTNETTTKNGSSNRHKGTKTTV